MTLTPIVERLVVEMSLPIVVAAGILTTNRQNASWKTLFQKEDISNMSFFLQNLTQQNIVLLKILC